MGVQRRAGLLLWPGDPFCLRNNDMLGSHVEPGEIVEILMVEDNPQDAELAIRALKKHRLANRLIWLKDGAEALNAIFGPDEAPNTSIGLIPRLILLDLNLPKIDGHEVLRRLKSDVRTRAIPVVVLTSSVEETDLCRSYTTGANSYVVKPIDFDGLSEVVRQLGMYWLLLNRPMDGSSPHGR